MSIDIRPLGGPPTTAEPSATTRSPIDATSRMIIGTGTATAAMALLGGLLGAWPFVWSGLVMAGAGLTATAVAWRRGTVDGATDVEGRDLELGAGLVAAAIGVIGALELPFEVAGLDARGGVAGAVLTVAIAISGVFMLVGAIRRWPSAADVLVGEDRGVRVAYAGIGLGLVGWLANVTIGAWTTPAGVGVTTWLLAAGLVLRWSSDPSSDGRPVAGAWVAVVCAVLALLLGLDHLMRFVGQSAALGPLDWLAMLPYLIGVALALVGTVWTAYERTMDAQERSNIGIDDLG